MTPQFASTVKQAFLAVQRGDLDVARRHIDAMRPHAASDDGRFMVGMLEYSLGDYAAAVRTLRPIRKKDPIALTALLGAGAALQDDGLFNESIAALRADGRGEGVDEFLKSMSTTDPWHKAAAQSMMYDSLFDRPDTDVPEWKGEHVGRLCVMFRAGYGDSWLAGRYLAGVRKKVGDVIALVRKSELRVFAENVPDVEYVTDAALVGCDAYCGAMRLPFVAGERFGNAKWINATAEKLPGFNVGVAWSGDPMNTNDRFRSCPIQALMPLFDISGVTFHSLQVGPRSVECPAGVIDQSKNIRDWQDTARIIASLNLMICIDSSVANFTGAMGRPVWVLVEPDAEWRWKSPYWFPSAKVFKQERRGDWAPVIDRVRAELARAGRNL